MNPKNKTKAKPNSKGKKILAPKKKTTTKRLVKKVVDPPPKATAPDKPKRKVGKMVFRSLLFLAIGIMLSFTVMVTRAAYVATRSDGSPLTSAIWNEMVNKVNILGPTNSSGLTEGQWCSVSGGQIYCNNNRPVMAETDPRVGSIVSGSWCTGTGSNSVNCTSAQPVMTESDPQVRTLNSGRWCTTDGAYVDCTTAPPVLTESDPGVPASIKDGIAWGEVSGKPIGTLTAGNWCTFDGTNINCSSSAPVLTDKVGTLTNGRWCTSDGTRVNCNTNAPIINETDPEVGTVNDGGWCVGGSGGVLYCNQADPNTCPCGVCGSVVTTPSCNVGIQEYDTQVCLPGGYSSAWKSYGPNVGGAC